MFNTINCYYSLKLNVKVIIIWLFSTGILFTEEFLFNLSTKGISFASFQMNSLEDAQTYKISSSFESTGILGAFTRIKVVSGAHGNVSTNDNLNLKPIEVLSRWENLFNKKQSRIRYKDNKITYYEVLPKPRENPYAINPFQLQDVIDPLTVTYWMLKKKNLDQICIGKKFVSEGQSLILVQFNNKKKLNDLIYCEGQFIFLKGFDPVKHKNTNYSFNLIYENSPQKRRVWTVRSMSFDTRIGLIKAVRVNKM